MQQIKVITIIFILLLYSCHSNNDEGNDIINKVINIHGVYPKIVPCIYEKTKTFADAEPPVIGIDIEPVPPFDSTPCVYKLLWRKILLKDFNKDRHGILIRVDYFDNIFENQLEEKERRLIWDYLGDGYKVLKYKLDVEKLDASNFVTVGENINDFIIKDKKTYGLEIYEFSEIFISADGKRAVVYLYYRGGSIFFLEKFGRNWYVSVAQM